jgi:hypothetical protein
MRIHLSVIVPYKVLVLSILMFNLFQVYLVPAAGTINNRSIIPQLEDRSIERTFGVPIKEAMCTKPPDTTGISRSALISMAALTIKLPRGLQDHRCTHW